MEIGAVDGLQALFFLDRCERKRRSISRTTLQLAQPIGCLFWIDVKEREEVLENHFTVGAAYRLPSLPRRVRKKGCLREPLYSLRSLSAAFFG